MQLRFAVAASVLWLVASCGHAGVANSASSGVESSSDERVEELPSIDVSELTDAEGELWVTLINEQLAPCGQPLSVARCVVQGRQCGNCAMAARYLKRLVMEGYDPETIEQHYAGRFAEEKKVALALQSAHAFGPPSAQATVVEFFDYQCPHCAATHPELMSLGKRFEGKVRIIFKHFPLAGHARAMHAARAAEAAAMQGKFFEMHELLFTHQHDLEDTDLVRYAEMIGLDTERFRSDLVSAAVEERVLADRQEGERLAISGTPTLYINGRLLLEPPTALEAYLKEEVSP